MTLKKILAAFFFITGCVYSAHAQHRRNHSQVNQQVNEKVYLSTDRTFYFAGERIFFKATRVIDQFYHDTLLSNVLYLELYDQNNNPIIQKKEQIGNGISYGNIEIPTDAITGNYFLRAYTLYMRNFGPEAFYTTEIKIINPDLPSQEALQTIKTEKDSTLKPANSGLKIQTEKDVFPSQSLIAIHLEDELNANLCVSVVKKGSYDENKTGLNNYAGTVTYPDTLKKITWYPEIRSVSISGKVIDNVKKAPLKNILVYVSVLGYGKQYHAVRTNNNGEFICSLPNLNETSKIYICAQGQNGIDAKVLINQDFAADFLKNNYIPDKIDSAKRELINAMYVNYQLTKEYNNVVKIRKTYLDTLSDPFAYKYEVIFLKDYVALPTMTNIFNEITPYIHAKINKEGASISVFDKVDKTRYDHPLILLDGIPFQDDSALLSISPAMIVSIGVIAQPIVHGSEILQGIINIKSVDGNMAGLKLPKNLVVLDYTTYSPLTTMHYEYKKDKNAGNREPDFRNTMYWNPSVTLNNGKTTLQFYTTDYASDYDIIVRGVDEDGNFIFAKKTIKIYNAKP